MTWIVTIRHSLHDGTTATLRATYRRRPSSQLFADGQALVIGDGCVLHVSRVNSIVKKRKRK